MTASAPEAPAVAAAKRATTEARDLGYQPALDGLRALAVVLVLLAHDGAGRATERALAPGGFIGVDIFFVLSGFLITWILLDAHARTGRTASVQFWLRRARRLLPPLVVLLVIVGLYAVVVAPTSGMTGVRGDAVAMLLYVENWWFLPQRVTVMPFSQVWSLSIEEQWYLIWPFLLAALLLLAGGRTRRLLGWTLGLALVSWALMAGLGVAHWTRIYAGTDTRAWELLAGAALAMLLLGRAQVVGPRARMAVEVAGFGGLVVIGWAAASMGIYDAWVYQYGLVLVVLATACVIAAGIQEQSRVIRPLLGWRPFVALGLISYGVYLYHLVIFFWMSERSTGLHGLTLTAARWGVTFAVATASYLLVERPVRFRIRWNPARVAWSGVAMAGALALVFAGTGSLRQDDPALVERGQQYAKIADDSPHGSTRVLVAGDGLAFQMSYRIKSPIDIDGLSGSTAAMLGCGVAGGGVSVDGAVSPPSRCTFPWPDLYRRAVESFRPHVTVLMVGQGEIFDRVVSGRLLRVGTPALAHYLDGQLERARTILTGGGARMLLATVPCAAPAATTAAPFAAVLRDSARVAWVNQVRRSFAAAHPDTVRLVDLDALLCRNGDAHTVAGGIDLRPDGVTLSPGGVRYVWRWLAPLARAARQARATGA